MNRFIIVDGLPYLFDKGKAFAVRWDEKGFTVGAEVELTEAPSAVYNEISILAKCAGNLDSIQEAEESAEDAEAEGQAEQTEETEEETETEEEAEEAEESSEEVETEEQAEQTEETETETEAAEGPAEEVETEEAEAEDEADLDEMTLEELKGYAKEHGISLNGARTKAAIIEAINAAE